jgi:serine/threonine protein kinase
MKHKDYTGQTMDNRYRILRLLGEGGMGSVYLGQHIVIGKKVAVKFLHAEFAANANVVKRFYREAQAAAAIQHKNIIDVSDVGVSPDKEPYLVMEYLEGESLSSMLDRTGPISLPAACGILEPMLSALGAAHEKGIVHRDLKPENIFLAHLPDEPPVIKLIDFGISKFTAPGHSKMTGTGALLGTPAYMSPEQIRGDASLDHRADIYSVGVVLYEMLTGRLPFQGVHHNALLISALTDAPIPPRESYASFPSEVEPLLMRLLGKDPAERPQSAAALLAEIKKLKNYEERHTHLSEYASGITKRSVAGGDLGASVPSGSGQAAASDVLSELSAKSTPADWAATAVSTKRSRRLISGMAISVLVAALAVAGLVIWLKAGGKPSEAPVVPLAPPARELSLSPAPKAQAVKSVRIEVTEAPEGATIFYDGMKMPKRSFLVPASDITKKLRVTAPGYQEHLVGVIPDKDQKISAVLEPVPKEAERETKPKRRSGDKKAKPGASKSGGREKEKPKIVKSGKTKLAEDFE